MTKHTSKNDIPNKVYLVQLKNNRYAATNPPKNKNTQLNEILKSFSQTELKNIYQIFFDNIHSLHLLHLHPIIQSL